MKQFQRNTTFNQRERENIALNLLCPLFSRQPSLFYDLYCIKSESEEEVAFQVEMFWLGPFCLAGPEKAFWGAYVGGSTPVARSRSPWCRYFASFAQITSALSDQENAKRDPTRMLNSRKESFLISFLWNPAFPYYHQYETLTCLTFHQIIRVFCLAFNTW